MANERFVRTSERCLTMRTPSKILPLLSLVIAIAAVALLCPRLQAQVPDVEGHCVENCGGDEESSSSSGGSLFENLLQGLFSSLLSGDSSSESSSNSAPSYSGLDSVHLQAIGLARQGIA